MTTNQSFIKAYRRDAGVPSPLGNRAANPPRTSGARATSPQAAGIANADLFGSSVAFVSPGTSFVYDSYGSAALSSNSAPTHADPSPYLTEAYPIAEPRAGDTIATTRADRPTTPVRRPLSSFTNRTNRSVQVADPAPMSLRPGTTIASFQWPEECRRLLARHGRHFDRVTDALWAQADQGRSLIGVLGLFRGIGCSTTTLCLAARLAQRGRRVVLVDGHFRAPQLAASLGGAQPTFWWQDVLAGDAPLADAMIHAKDDQLDLLPLDPHAPRESLRSDMRESRLPLSATAGALRHAYDLALVDLGTFFDPISQPTLLTIVEHMRIDVAVAVTGPDRHDPRDLESIAEHLDQTNCELLGTIDNRVT